MSDLGVDASRNETLDVNGLSVTAVTGTSNTLFLDVVDASAGANYQLVYTDQTAVNIPYEAKNKVTVKNFKFDSTYADLSLNTETSGRITLTGPNIYDGAKMGLIMKGLDDPLNGDVSFNDNAVSGKRPLINGGLFAPASNYIVSMHPTHDATATDDASLSLNFGGALAGRGVAAYKVHILYTDRTSLATTDISYVLSPDEKANGVLDNIVKISGVQDKSFEFAVRFEDQLGAYTQWVGAVNSAERTAAPSAVTNVDISGQDKGVNGAGGILQVSFTAPTYAPNPINGYHIYYIQNSDASGANVHQAHATKVSVGPDVSHNIPVANSVAGDASSNYHVWVAAVSNVDGVPTEGPLDRTSTEAQTSNEYAVTGRPEAPTLVSVSTGQDIDATNTLTDASMTGRTLIQYNDANKSNRGLAIDGAKVAVFRQQDVHALPTMIVDASYNTILGGAISGQGNTVDVNLESIDISGSSALEYVLDASGIWQEADSGTLADGTEYVAYVALANSNGAGLGAPSAMFKPSGLADIEEMRILGNADAAKLSGVSGNHYVYPTDVSFVQPGNNKITLRLTTADVCGNDTSALFGGLPSLSGIEYAVYGDAANNDDKRFVGSAPANNVLLDICGGDNVEETAQLHRTLPISSTGLYDITHYYDASGILQPLVNGTVYNVETWARNANTVDAGTAGARSFKFTDIAPMGALGSATSITNSSAPASIPTTSSGTAIQDKLVLDISLNDPSGNAFTGGHIVAGYKCLGKQTVGGIERTVFDQSITVGDADGTNLTRKLECRGTSDDENAAFGYPVNVTITPFADASANGLYGNYDATGGLFLGSPATTILTGPVVGSNYDEVGALTVTEMDSKLDVFFTPASTGGFADNQENVVLDSYTVELYDASFGTTTGGAFSTDKLAQKVATEIIPHNAQSTEYSKSFEGLVNGHAYIIRVVTNFSQGPASNREQSSTLGLWFGNGQADQNVAISTSNPGFYDMTQTNVTWDAALAGQSAVPRGIPIITADIQTNKLEIVTNGSGALSYAAMIQVLPASGVSVAGQENSFYLDLADSGNGSSVEVIAGNPNNKKVTINTGTLGSNWINEKNYIFASNEAGTRVVTTNITNAASNGALVSLF